MKKSIPWLIYLLILVIGVIAGLFLQSKYMIYKTCGDQPVEDTITAKDSTETGWSEDFSIAEIPSSADGKLQKAYIYKSKSGKPRPLIVSLHTWSHDYTQIDPLSGLCLTKDINYIHPDFRGVNRTLQACCSDLVISDIDDAISFAIHNCNVDTAAIYITGYSGGGYATLAMFMKSKHPVKKFSAWVPISDLIAWYRESDIRKNGYGYDILKCTGSEDGVLNETTARERSPIYWETPVNKIPDAQLIIYAGVYDGIQGSVPITHSINFYNKILRDLSVTDRNKYITTEEKASLLEYRRPLGNYGKIADRDICLQKEYKSIKVTIFIGNHEMLAEYALDELLRE